VQYFIRPVTSFQQFADQVNSLIATAADYKADVVLLPEYFTIQLFTLEDTQLPAHRLVRRLARRADAVHDLLRGLAIEHRLYLIGGTVAVPDPDHPETVYNDCPVFSPDGQMQSQGKLHMTRWEGEDWQVTPRQRLRVFDSGIGKFAVTICYDVEFPELARSAARAGCSLLFCPSCTDDRQGFLRVRYCAQARAIENQMYVVHASTVGSLPQVPSVSLNYGQASILTPSDFAFSRDGILAEGDINAEMIIVGELNMAVIEQAREDGTVLPLRDSVSAARVAADMDTVTI
jgi:predicted amidohydrolase